MASVRRQRVDEVQAQGKAAVVREFANEILHLRKQKWGNLWGYVFIAPAVIMYLIFQAWPILRGLFMAFSDYRWLLPETQGLGRVQRPGQLVRDVCRQNILEKPGDRLQIHAHGYALDADLFAVHSRLDLQSGEPQRRRAYTA